MGIVDIKIDVMREFQLKKWNKRVMQTPQQQQSDGSAVDLYTGHELYQAATKSNLAEFMSILESERAEMGQHVSRDDVLRHCVSPLGNTLLHVAAASGNLNVLMEIANISPSLISSMNCNSDTPLHLAAEAGHEAVVRELVSKLRDGNGGLYGQMVKNEQGYTALHKALISFNKDTAEVLVHSNPQAMFCLTNEEKSGFYLAAEAGYEDMIKQALESYADENLIYEMVKGKPPVHAAIWGKHMGALRILVEEVPKFVQSRDDDGRTPLHLAAFNGYLDGVEYLLSQYAFAAVVKDHFGFYPIHWAAMQGHEVVVEILLKYSLDPAELLDRKCRNVLHVAAESGQTNMVVYLLKNAQCRKLINAKDLEGNTPLHLATMNWHPRIISALTWNKNLDMNLSNNNGLTALDAAEFYIEDAISFQQRLTWTALTAAGAPRGPLKHYHFSTNQLSQRPRPLGNLNNYKERVNTLLVVATLIATITYAAGFTVPGGYNSDSNQGQATLLHQNVFSLFILCDTIALNSAMIVAVCMIWAQLGDRNLVLIALKLGLPLLGVSLTMMAIAFMAGIYVVVSDVHWLAQGVAVMGAIFVATLSALSFLLCFPVSFNNFIIRYITYYLFHLLMYLSNNGNSRI